MTGRAWTGTYAGAGRGYRSLDSVSLQLWFNLNMAPRAARNRFSHIFWWVGGTKKVFNIGV